MPSPDRAAIQRGLDYEARVADDLGGSLQPGSGNKFYARSDAQGKGLLGSCKASGTGKRSWAQTMRELALAAEYAYGTGDIPFLAIEERYTDAQDDDVIVIRRSDWNALLADLSSYVVPESPAVARRRRASVPALLRD